MSILDRMKLLIRKQGGDPSGVTSVGQALTALENLSNKPVRNTYKQETTDD